MKTKITWAVLHSKVLGYCCFETGGKGNDGQLLFDFEEDHFYERVAQFAQELNEYMKRFTVS